MNRKAIERLLDCIGQMKDSFLEEAETTNVVHTKTSRRRRAAKYGAYGAAGLAVLGGAAAAVWRIRSNRIAKSA